MDIGLQPVREGTKRWIHYWSRSERLQGTSTAELDPVAKANREDWGTTFHSGKEPIPTARSRTKSIQKDSPKPSGRRDKVPS